MISIKYSCNPVKMKILEKFWKTKYESERDPGENFYLMFVHSAASSWLVRTIHCRTAAQLAARRKNKITCMIIIPLDIIKAINRIQVS